MIKFIPETRGMLGYLRVFWGFYFVIVLIVWYIVYLFYKGRNKMETLRVNGFDLRG
jgi:hypothetical protein